MAMPMEKFVGGNEAGNCSIFSGRMKVRSIIFKERHKIQRMSSMSTLPL